MKHVNHLKGETSPYLLQHAHNPVDWYPWCEEAFHKAVTEDKPVFLSIGYSTCHWCHVMARESFENEKIARSLNDDFVSIKVDREERPDIDLVYMQACQLVTGSGGWPMSVFLTPEKKPFFAGTYFPPDAFGKLIKILSSQWKSSRNRIFQSADQIEAAMQQINHSQNSRTSSNSADILMKNALEYFRSSFDAVNGGFGAAPKFPSPHNLMFLLTAAPQMAEKTLLQMYKGGIFDHIGGGFSRYSTDDVWLAPHFEKMLYDNTLLAMAYTLAYAKTRNGFYRHVAERTLDYMEREMRSDESGFYSAQDADTDGEEGKYYLFTPEEINAVLGDAAGKTFCQRYDIEPSGNFEGKSIPNLLKSASAIDVENSDNLTRGSDFADSLKQLYQYRKNRLSLHRDEKILTGWNALAAAAFAFAGRIFENKKLTDTAEQTVAFIQTHMIKNDSLLASFAVSGEAAPAFLDDCAFYTLALIQLYKTTGKNEYFSRAIHMTDKTIKQFWDETHHGFFFSGKQNEKLITAVKETYDGAIPSGNAVMSYNLIQMINEPESGHSDTAPEHALPQLKDILAKHHDYMNRQASAHPAGHSFYLFSRFPLKEISCQDGACSPTGRDVF